MQITEVVRHLHVCVRQIIANAFSYKMFYTSKIKKNNSYFILVQKKKQNFLIAKQKKKLNR